MRTAIFLLGTAAALSACGQSDRQSANNSASAAAPKKERPACCFFKDEETKGWAASTDKAGNVVVSGKVYREDSRYQAVLGPPKISGSTLEVAPTIVPNTGAYGAPDNWWEIKTTIPNSAAVETVKVVCGAKTVATLAVPRKKSLVTGG
jgi:hypothetical protein